MLELAPGLGRRPSMARAPVARWEGTAAAVRQRPTPTYKPARLLRGGVGRVRDSAGPRRGWSDTGMVGGARVPLCWGGRPKITSPPTSAVGVGRFESGCGHSGPVGSETRPAPKHDWSTGCMVGGHGHAQAGVVIPNLKAAAIPAMKWR